LKQNDKAKEEYDICLELLDERSDEYLENKYYIRPDNLYFVRKTMIYYDEFMKRVETCIEKARLNHNKDASEYAQKLEDDTVTFLSRMIADGTQS
jgi:hypothetical protein